MYVALRWICGLGSLALLFSGALLFQVEPARREWTLAGIPFVLSLRLVALWIAQISYLCFAASRICISRAKERSLRNWERLALTGVRTTLLSVVALPVLWILWSCLRGH